MGIKTLVQNAHCRNIFKQQIAFKMSEQGEGEKYSDRGRILGSFMGFGAILANKWTVSGLNMTHNAFYHLNKV